MSTWLALRALKFLAQLALAVGIGLSIGSRRQSDRAMAALWLATPGLFVTWMVGYGLVKLSERSIVDPFVAVGVLASLVALHGAVLCAMKPAPKMVSRWLALAGLAVATVAMVFRDADSMTMGAACAVAAALSAALVIPLPAPDGDLDPELGAKVMPWFSLLGRLEGLSLLVLFAGIPLRKMADIHLDGGTGALGWVHGSLFLLYLQAVLVAGRIEGWSLGQMAMGAVAAFLPGGTFAFEWSVKR